MTSPDPEVPSPPAAVAQPPSGRVQVLLARSLLVAYLVVGVGVMWLAAPRVPYADQYRFLATYLQNPFPHNVWIADNGHREVLPNLVRVADLYFFDASQSLQVVIGILLGLATIGLMVRAFRSLQKGRATAAALACCLGLFWLGNGRKLAHCNEAVSMFFVLLWLTLGLRALIAQERDRGIRGSCGAAVAGLCAVLSFGSGAACFAAFFLVLLLRRAPLRQWLPVGLTALLGAALLLLGGGEGASGVAIAPLLQLDQLLRWLGAPFVWILSPLLDVGHAGRVPTRAGAWVCQWIAGAAEASLGDCLSARWPALAFGGLGMVALSSTTLGALRRGLGPARPTGPRMFALGLAWFGVTVGALVVLARSRLFIQLPDQLSAPRYLAWSMMFWIGLLLTVVCNEALPARRVTWTVLAAALLLAPSQVWMGRLAFRLLDTARITALGAAAGVLDADYELYETDAADLRRAVPELRAAGKAMFAWPETALLGRVPAAAQIQQVEATALVLRPVPNLFAGPGSELRCLVAEAPRPRLLVLDAAGVVVGLAMRDLRDGRWRGFLRGVPEPAGLSLASLR